MTFGVFKVASMCCLLGIGLTGTAQAAAPAPRPAVKPAARPKGVHRRPARKQLDINTATKAQLAHVPGLNEALAEQIIAHRPYLTKEHLVLNKALSQSVFLSVRDYLMAIPPGVKQTKPKASRGAKPSGK
ncbi:MAG TPA: helix-hairpin-helix domain-containing protein [Holophagaceae bacterium]